MTPIPPKVLDLCREFSIEIIPGHKYPEGRQTRAVSTLNRIYSRYGEDHLRWVLRTLAETSNNHTEINEFSLWAASDLLRACRPIVESEPSKWLEVFDAAPIGELQFALSGLRGFAPLRYALDGMLYERIVRAFGPKAIQPDLFDDRRMRK